MAVAPTTYFVAEYDGQAGGEYTEKSLTEVTWSGGAGFIITDIVDINVATAGKLIVALISGDIPTNNEVMTQGAVTADCAGPLPNGDSTNLLYPGYMREDLSLSAAGALAWTGPADEVTHSFLYDGQSTNDIAGDILTFADGQTAELKTIDSDAGASGEYSVRWASFIDTLLMPDDNDTWSGSGGGDGALDGVVHDRSYSALHMHRFLADLSDDADFAGNDVMATYKPTPSSKDTDAIVNFLGPVTMTDTISKHTYGGSIKQGTGDTEKLYSGLNIQITDSDQLTEPVVITSDSIVVAFWSSALNPDSIAGRCRFMLPTREDGADYDGKRVKGKLLRFGDTYFTGSTTLGTATTALALFSATDNNNQTAIGTVAGAPYNTITHTQGFTTEDHGEGSGATPFADVIDFGSASSAQTYERTKWEQDEGSAATLFGRNARLFDGVNLNFKYDALAGGPFNEGATAEVIAWGQIVPYTGQTLNFTVGNVLKGGTSGARGRILADPVDAGATGTLYVALDGTTNFSNTEALTELGGGTGDGTSGTVVANTAAGTALVLADDVTGDNLYCQLLQGVAPADNQEVIGVTTDATADVDAATTLQTRVVNTQYVGSYTGANFLTNFGISIDSTDAIAGDLFPNLLGNNIPPPNNQTGNITGVEADMYVTCFPWDGSTLDAVGDPEPNFNELSLSGAHTGANTTVTIVEAMPDNTPQAGFLRCERDSDNELDKLEYVSHTGSIFTLGGITPNVLNAMANLNTVMRAPIDELAGGTSIGFTAIVGTPEQFAITARRGGTVTPIKPAKATSTFGVNGFDVGLQPVSDV